MREVPSCSRCSGLTSRRRRTLLQAVGLRKPRQVAGPDGTRGGISAPFGLLLDPDCADFLRIISAQFFESGITHVILAGTGDPLSPMGTSASMKVGIQVNSLPVGW